MSQLRETVCQEECQDEALQEVLTPVGSTILPPSLGEKLAKNKSTTRRRRREMASGGIMGLTRSLQSVWERLSIAVGDLVAGHKTMVQQADDFPGNQEGLQSVPEEEPAPHLQTASSFHRCVSDWLINLRNSYYWQLEEEYPSLLSYLGSERWPGPWPFSFVCLSMNQYMHFSDYYHWAT